MKMFMITRLMVLMLALVAGTLTLTGCNQDNFDAVTGPAAEDMLSAADGGAFAKKGSNTGQGQGNSNKIQFPIQVSRIYEYNAAENYYEGGILKFGHQSMQSYFVLEENALTPPTPADWGRDVEITMTIDYDSTANELVFTFGPHGCQFSPGARVRLDYKRLGVDVANLYYIDDNGNYIPQTPDQISTHAKWMMIKLDHFSRYAVSQD